MPDNLYSFRNTLAFEALAITTTATSLTAATYAAAQEAIITIASNAIRWRSDGTAPTSAVGHVAAAGDILLIKGGQDISKFQAISQTGAQANLSVTYYK